MYSWTTESFVLCAFCNSLQGYHTSKYYPVLPVQSFQLLYDILVHDYTLFYLSIFLLIENVFLFFINVNKVTTLIFSKLK